MSMEILVSGDNDSGTVFSIYMLESLAKVRDTAMLLLNCSPPLTPLADTTITCRLVIPLSHFANLHFTEPTELL